MHYTIVRLRNVRMAVVLVENNRLIDARANGLLAGLQLQFKLPVMLISRAEGRWEGARARADFDVAPFMYSLMAMDDLEWHEVPVNEEQELPF